ncbi:MAG: aminotransferase class I/II-fold pyridoxal phosphate-dependent enzyme [Myxococcales bacterium]|jgi:aspartate/methionine/tyrosine aminotransferase
MNPTPFALERYFALHEFTAPYLLSCSDTDGLAMSEVLGMADAEVRALWDELRLGYTESRGLPALRAEVAGMYEGRSADDILIGAPEELIFVAMNMLLRPGDRVVCAAPAYQSLHEVARAIGCAVDFWRPREADSWHFDPDELRPLLRGARLLIVNFPHNPTGALPSAADFSAVMALAAEEGVRVFSDEMYRLLEHAPDARLASACEVASDAVSLSGMSKVFGMAGTRIGWLATGDARLMERLASFKDYTTICSSAPSELLALAALRNRAAIIERHRARILRNLETLRAFVSRSVAFALPSPRAGSVCLLRLRDGSAADFCRQALEESGILMVPSTLFDFGDAHIRIGLGREDMPQVLGRLEDWLAST